MQISEKLKERFCKDCNLPIKIFSEPVFSDRLHLYDDLYNCLDMYDRFISELEQYQNEQEYFEEYNRVKDEAIDFIKSSAGYQQFNAIDMNTLKCDYQGLPSKDIYKTSFDGRVFISVDMKKANFSSLNYYKSDIFRAKTWEEFIGRYTENSHIVYSKYIRQVILGNCNPKRHITLEKYIMGKMLGRILKVSDILKDVVFMSNDEIVFNISEYNPQEIEKITKEISEVVDNFEVEMKIEKFTLLKIWETEGYMKVFDDGSYELKGLDSIMIPYVIRFLNREAIQNTDRLFMYNGLVAEILDIPEIHILGR